MTDIIIGIVGTKEYGRTRAVYTPDDPARNADAEPAFGDEFRDAIVKACRPLIDRHAALTAERQDARRQEAETAAELARETRDRAVLQHRHFGDALSTRLRAADDRIAELTSDGSRLRVRLADLDERITTAAKEVDAAVRSAVESAAKDRSAALAGQMAKVRERIRKKLADDLQAFIDALNQHEQYQHAGRHKEVADGIVSAALAR